MSFKDVMFYLVCAATWFILLPLFLVVGTIALVGYAVLSELGEYVLGRTAKALDNPMSSLKRPGALMLSAPRFPYVSVAGWANAAVLIQLSMVWPPAGSGLDKT